MPDRDPTERIYRVRKERVYRVGREREGREEGVQAEGSTQEWVTGIQFWDKRNAGVEHGRCSLAGLIGDMGQ